VIGPAVHDRASHHEDLARSKRVFDYVQRLIEELVHALVLGVEQLRDKNTRTRGVRFPASPGPGHAELSRDRGNRNAGEQGPGNDVPFCYSIRGQAWWPAAPADHRVYHLSGYRPTEKALTERFGRGARKSSP
jgi:hypothetical protein